MEERLTKQNQRLNDLADFKRKALIIEDNELNRELLAAILENEFDIMTAGDGNEGLRILSEHYKELSVILLDVNMPVCDGFEFLEKSQKDPFMGSVPVIVTTANDSEDSELKALNLGATDFVRKPYNAKVVMGRIHSIIKLRETKALVNTVEIDELTGLYTMPAFNHHAEVLMKSEQYSDFDLVVADVQDFKLVNSVFGEKTGDEVLRFLGKRMSSAINNGMIGRQGDRFFCLYPSEYRPEKKVWQRMVASAMKYAPIPNLFVNFGIYIEVDKEQPISILCDRVMMAVQSIKNDYTENTAYYDERMSAKRMLEQKMEADFESALANEEFVVWYQPKIDVVTEEMVAAEALVRWVNSEGKMVSPGMFISLFEKDGLIGRLDEYIFRKVCEFQRVRLNSGRKVVPVSVNLSRSSIFQKDTGDKYAKIVYDNEIPFDLIPIELTESAAIVGQRIRELAQELVEIGFSLHMDDFGAGYSSLASLSTLPITTLKLDKSLNDQIGNTRGDIVLRHTIQIAQELGMEVVAEGVEDEKQIAFLRAAGCNMIQGYYYSAPKSQAVFEQMLDENKNGRN